MIGLLGWFACLVRGRMPQGLRDLGTYAVGYGAQATGYLLLVTDRYPTSDPAAVEPARAARPPGPDRGHRRALAVAFDGLLPAAAVHPAPRLAPAVECPRRGRGADHLDRGACDRQGAPRAPPLPGGVHPLRRAHLRVPVPRRRAVPRLRRRRRLVPGRHRRRPASWHSDASSRCVSASLLSWCRWHSSAAALGHRALTVVGFLAWWYAIFKGRMPLGPRPRCGRAPLQLLRQMRTCSS